MYPAIFTYMRPTSINEALQMLADTPNAKVLAGGHSLIPALKLRLSQPDTLVDIGRIDSLKGIHVEGDRIIIGAATPHATIAASTYVQAQCRALAQACGRLGDPQVRNWGTLGGNLAHADPASDPPTVVLALNATFYLQGPSGERTVKSEDFFIDLFTTDMQPGELLTKISIPIVPNRKSAYAKLSHPASRYAVVGVCAVLGMDNGVCTSARIAIGGATARPVLSPGAAASLVGSPITDATLIHAAQAISDEVSHQTMGDLYASSEYRTAMAGVFLKRAVLSAME